MDSSGIDPHQEYKVSVFEMKVLADPNALFTTDSKLAPKMTKSAREGVKDVGRSQKGKRITLVDTVPNTLAEEFYAKVTGVNTTAKDCRLYLSTICEKYDSNILIWSLYVGDDAEIKYLAFLYRRDIDTIGASAPALLKRKQPETEQNEVAQRTTRDLLVKSIERPQWTDKGVTYVSEHKQETLWGLAALLGLLEQWNSDSQ